VHHKPDIGVYLINVNTLGARIARQQSVKLHLSPGKPTGHGDSRMKWTTAIRELHQSLSGGRKLKCHWVKGHQDAHTTYEELSPTAKLNVDVDTMASNHYWSGIGKKPTKDVPHLGEMRVTVSINGIRFPSKIDEQLRYHINGSYLKTYMQKHHRWNEKVWNLIDFDSFGQYFAHLPGRKQVQYMKFVHDIQPLGLHKQRMSQKPILY
jgi:hypothetical protein